MRHVGPAQMVAIAATAGAIAGAAVGWWTGRATPGAGSYADLFADTAPSVVSVSVEGSDPRLGSGFAVAPDEVVTSLHIVDGASAISVRDVHGRRHEAHLLGRDARADLALLSVPSADLAPLDTNGSRPLRVGDPAVTIGNPFGLGHSLSAGVVGQQGRHLEPSSESPLQVDFIQLSMPLNPGNSGGPLLDGEGNLAGVLSGVHATGQAIAFAIPVALLQDALPPMRSGATLSRAYLGARFQQAGDRLVVRSLTPHGPAARAGLRTGDIVARFDGTAVRTEEGLFKLLDARAGGDRVDVEGLRDGRPLQASVVLADWAAQPVVAAGMTLRAAAGVGGEVVAVRPRSRGADAGVRVGDLLRAVDGVPARAPADIKRALTSGQAVQLDLLRSGVPITLRLSPAPGHPVVDGAPPR